VLIGRNSGLRRSGDNPAGVVRFPIQARKRVYRMSEDKPTSPHSSPTSSGGMFLRILVAVAVLAALGGVIWYTNR
jgi:hypothetical protein